MRRPFLHSTATRLSLLAVFIWIGSILATAQITIPYPTFVAGTVIDPDQVNSNFSTLGTTALNRTGGTLTGNMAVSTNITVDGADISDYLDGSGNLTVTGMAAVTGVTTLSNHLRFGVDNTHDIGASGATRPRDFFLGRNASVAGTSFVGGQFTVSGALISNPTVNEFYSPIRYSADNTFDIGQSGAFRPRDFFLARNAVVGGTLGVTGATTLTTATLNGNLTAATDITIDGVDLSDFLSGSNLTVPGTTTLNTVAYTWPAAQGSAGTALRNNGSGTVSWGWASGVSSQSGSFTADNANDYYIVSATATVTLPACDSGRTGKWFHVKNTGAAATITLDGNASETIDGATTYAFSQQYAAISIVCNGGGAWSIF